MCQHGGKVETASIRDMSAQIALNYDVALDRLQRDAHASRLEHRPSPPIFDGATFDPAKDEIRLTKHLARVYDCLKDGSWWTLQRLKTTIGGSEAGCSARIRDLRKEKFGSHRIERRRVSDSGLYEYRMGERAA